ncbi:MAG: hypothetical protein Q4A70_00675 [Candidatus Saccharibacteria bacterium]|nr:hypothetical protein [Candidatus Saccharibacteria bacterium]
MPETKLIPACALVLASAPVTNPAETTVVMTIIVNATVGKRLQKSPTASGGFS